MGDQTDFSNGITAFFTAVSLLFFCLNVAIVGSLQRDKTIAFRLVNPKGIGELQGKFVLLWLPS